MGRPVARGPAVESRPVLFRRSGAFQKPVLALLRDACSRVSRPWPLLVALLRSRVEHVCAEALETATAPRGGGHADGGDDEVCVLADLAEREGSPLCAGACLDGLAALLALRAGTGSTALAAARQRRPSTDARPPAARDLRSLLLDPDRPAVRRLAARVLDATGRLPDAGVAREVLGASGAACLRSALAFTRARHLDLVGPRAQAGRRGSHRGCRCHRSSLLRTSCGQRPRWASSVGRA